ncbi:protein LBH isoform X2 [Scleropages formosus]|uniref:protein LBH isoform X2 n=1 Tax=Scleropages formosus TaxID=113540 RepID=UPI000878F8BF|nr:protein LBH isoform X2 [Scleropages formosus]
MGIYGRLTFERGAGLHRLMTFSSKQEAIFPDPSDFERCCKLKDRLPSIVVEPTEGEVESGELRWPPEEFLVSEGEEEEEEEEEEEVDGEGKSQTGHQVQNSQH